MQYNIQEICRCCLKKIGDLKPLYGASLNEMLHCVTNLDVTPNDGFPELICFQCVLQLSRSYRFKEQCIKSYKLILGYIEERKIQYENTLVSEFQSSDERFLYEDSHSNVGMVLDSVQHSAEVRSQEEYSGKIQNYPGTVSEGERKSEYKCNICSKQFSSIKKLNRHLKIHNNNKKYKCSKCNKTFSEKGNLNKHIHKHTVVLRNAVNKVYLCSICGKTFKYSSSLTKHMKFHTGKNLLHCSHCTKSFAEKSALEIHQRVHTGDRPFICQHCNRKFTQLCNLRKHFRSHSTERISEQNDL